MFAVSCLVFVFVFFKEKEYFLIKVTHAHYNKFRYKGDVKKNSPNAVADNII